MEVIKYAALALLAGCSPVFAQSQNCAPTEVIYEKLLGKYKEQRVFLGAGQGAVVEVWGNPETETWTLVITRTDGISCAPASGIGWESIPIVSGDPA